MTAMATGDRLQAQRRAAAHEQKPPEPGQAGPWFDVIAGVSVAGILLPEAIAYAGIAGVPPLHGLIAALAGLCIYPWLGTSRFAMVAPTSSAAAVFASAVAAGMDMAFALVLLTGLLFLLAGALRAGFLGAFISRPVLRGFAWALALTIAVKQIPHIVGADAPGAAVETVLPALWLARNRWNATSIAWGGAALALWLLLRHGLRHWAYVPTSLLVLGAGIALSAAGAFGAERIALVGGIAGHWQLPRWPQLSVEDWLRAAELAPALLLILFAESWGSVRALALQTGDRVDANRELLALGAANLASGLAQGLPVGAGFSAAAASYAVGARSKMTGVAAALALALMLWWARDWLALLPQPVLAAVVIGILSHSLWPRDLVAMLRQGRDAWLAPVAAAGVLLFGVLFGMLVAVGLSLAMALRRFAQPLVTELGQLDDTRDYVDRGRHDNALAVTQVLIVRPEEPLFFANSEQVLQEVYRRAVAQDARVVVLSLEVTDDLDMTATETLMEFGDRLSGAGVELLLARVKDRPREALAKLWGSRERTSPHCFWSVADAVDAARSTLAL
jgi:MFS superfamily sulfate permease-like transporter